MCSLSLPLILGVDIFCALLASCDILSLSHLFILSLLPPSSPRTRMDDSCILLTPLHDFPQRTNCPAAHISLWMPPSEFRGCLFDAAQSVENRNEGWGGFGSNKPTKEAGRQSGKESLSPHVGLIWDHYRGTFLFTKL